MSALEKFRQQIDHNMKGLESILALIKAELGVEPISIACEYTVFHVAFMLPTSEGERYTALVIVPTIGKFWSYRGPQPVREIVPTLRHIMAR